MPKPRCRLYKVEGKAKRNVRSTTLPRKGLLDFVGVRVRVFGCTCKECESRLRLQQVARQMPLLQRFNRLEQWHDYRRAEAAKADPFWGVETPKDRDSEKFREMEERRLRRKTLRERCECFGLAKTLDLTGDVRIRKHHHRLAAHTDAAASLALWSSRARAFDLALWFRMQTLVRTMRQTNSNAAITTAPMVSHAQLHHTTSSASSKKNSSGAVKFADAILHLTDMQLSMRPKDSWTPYCKESLTSK
mmetsp:Transcript_21034/g.45558  ORF Transcript_21034/g.45558 Transcript_21034/m.45558 type:complete len:247 (-) Transcript_21034:1354-2094(-)